MKFAFALISLIMMTRNALAQSEYASAPPLLPLPEQMRAQHQQVQAQQRFEQERYKAHAQSGAPIYPARRGQAPTMGRNNPSPHPAPAYQVTQPTSSYAQPNAGSAMAAYSAPNADSAAKPWYVGFKGELVFVEDWEREGRFDEVFDTGYAGSLIVGNRFSPYFRTELEGGYRYSETEDGGELQAFTALVNGYGEYPLPDTPEIIPYVGAGIGGYFQHEGAEENALAWRLMTGLSYQLPNAFEIALGYKYQQAPSLFETSSGDFDAESHNIELTLRKHF